MRPSRFFLTVGAVLLVVGLIAIGISFIMGGNWDETLSIVNMGNLSNYYRRNDNSELDSDAVIWDEQEDNSVFYDFSDKTVKKLEIDITNADLTISSGTNFTVTIYNIKKDDISCKVTSTGSLVIDNASNSFSFFNILRRRSFINRGAVELTIPSGFSFDNVSFISHTGNLIADPPIRASKATVKADSGIISIHELFSEKTSITAESGKVSVGGVLKGKTEIKCGSGAVEVSIDDDKNLYSYSADSGMGEISVDGTVYSGSNRLNSGKTMKDNIRMTCGSGRIKISFD